MNHIYFIGPFKIAKGGGVATVIRKSIPVISTEYLEKGTIECIKTKITFQKVDLSIINVYMPPDTTITNNDLDIIIPRDKYTIIVGDTNAKHSTWNATKNNSRGTTLHDWILYNNIVLLNSKQPTFQSSATGSGSTTDLTLVTGELLTRVTS